MAEQSLTTVTGSGTQSTTQSPQTAGQPGASGTRSASLQPGTATNLLSNNTGTGGVPLRGQALSTVNLGAKTTGQQQVQAAPAPKPRDINPVLISLPVLLVLVAVLMVWAMNRSVKSTT